MSDDSDMKRLRKAWDAGKASGGDGPLDMQNIIDEAQSELEAERGSGMVAPLLERWLQDEVAKSVDEVAANPDRVIPVEDVLARIKGKSNETKLHGMRTAWQEGIESGDYKPLDMEALKAEARRKLALVRRQVGQGDPCKEETGE